MTTDDLIAKASAIALAWPPGNRFSGLVAESYYLAASSE